MTTRAMVRLSGFVLLVGAVACGSGTGPTPPPPPPPPPGAPVVTPGPGGSVPVGSTFDLSATFTDTATDASPWSYDVAWGDGNSSSGSKSTIAPITASHSYATEGNYHVAVSVTNKRGATGSGSVSVDATAPVILAAGDIGDCQRNGDDLTGALLDTLVGIVAPLGDNAYLNGTDSEYVNCYAPNWGRQKSRTRPVAGNHDYNTPNATGYFDYFGSVAGDPSKGYYDYALGSWLVIVLNTGTDVPDNYKAGSPQEQWLRAELASHSQQCVLAMFHHPRFSTIKDRSPITYYTEAIWNALYEYGADLVLNGHDHAYQRFAPQRPDGTRDAAFGIRQIAVGTGGGEGFYSFSDTLPTGSNLEVRDNHTLGVLKVTLHAGSYDWRFIPTGGGTFTDSGSGTCHGRPM